MNGTMKARVALLEPHPLSDAIFGQLPEDRFEDLKLDIRDRGVQYHLHVDRFNRVICGSQRLRALKALRIQEVDVVLRDDLATEEEIRLHLIKDNLYRRHLTPRQIFTAAQELEHIYSQQADQRKQDGLKGITADDDERGRTSEKVAQDMGFSRSKYERMKRVFTSEEKDLIDKVDKGEVSITAAAAEVATRARVRAQPLPSEDAKSFLLRKIKFTHEVEKFVALLDKSPKSRFGPHADEVEDLLSDVADTIQGYLDGDDDA